MDKKIAGLLGAVATLASLNAAEAATSAAQDPTEILKASSYGDLLAPIPNASALLRAVDAMNATKAATPQPAELGSDVQVAQYYRHHHHHHHHHRYGGVGRFFPPVYRGRYHHHHHHHHRYRGY